MNHSSFQTLNLEAASNRLLSLTQMLAATLGTSTNSTISASQAWNRWHAVRARR